MNFSHYHLGHHRVQIGPRREQVESYLMTQQVYTQSLNEGQTGALTHGRSLTIPLSLIFLDGENWWCHGEHLYLEFDTVNASSLLSPWWRHEMETFSALLAIFVGNSPVTGEFTAQRPVTVSFDVLFDLRSINSWINNREAGDLRRHRPHYDVAVMTMPLARNTIAK